MLLLTWEKCTVAPFLESFNIIGNLSTFSNKFDSIVLICALLNHSGLITITY